MGLKKHPQRPTTQSLRNASCLATGEVCWEYRDKVAPAQSGSKTIKKVLGTQETSGQPRDAKNENVKTPEEVEEKLHQVQLRNNIDWGGGGGMTNLHAARL